MLLKGKEPQARLFSFIVQWYEVKRVIEEKSEDKRAETVM